MTGLFVSLGAKTVEWIDRIINDVDNEALQAEIRQEVKTFMAAYPWGSGVIKRAIILRE